MNEFDNYIKDYRSNNDNALWLSGESSEFFATYKVEKLVEWFGNLEHQTILDFGCGDGLMLSKLVQKTGNNHAYGVDPSPKSIAQAQKRYPGINFQISSEKNTQLNFENHFFDFIFSAGTFHHIPFALHHNYVQELMRILKPNGHLVIFELNPLNPLTQITFRNNPIDKNATMLSAHYSYNLLKKYGTTEIRYVAFYPKFLGTFRWSEKFFTKLPLGALYAAILKKEA